MGNAQKPVAQWPFGLITNLKIFFHKTNFSLAIVVLPTLRLIYKCLFVKETFSIY